MRIIRVFCRKTSYTPTDEHAFVGPPPGLFIPEHDEVHISCTFTWDKPLVEELAFQWEGVTNKPVKVGGPAYESPAEDFTPGLYVRQGITFTSRGCNNACPWCMVHRVEGPLKEIPITPGNIIQDNNFLQCSRAHQEKVFDMLRKEKQICFRGGLQTNLIDDRFVETVRGLRIMELWLACDTDAQLPAFRKACEKLVKAGFTQHQIKCYSLIGHDMEAEEQRNREIFRMGAMPFSQLERNFEDEPNEYSADWKAFERLWQRPALAVAHMREVDGTKL